jgi:hypothetical protein
MHISFASYANFVIVTVSRVVLLRKEQKNALRDEPHPRVAAKREFYELTGLMFSEMVEIIAPRKLRSRRGS